MLTDTEVDNILRPILAEMEPVHDGHLFCFWLKSVRSNTAFIQGLPDDTARQLDPILEQFGNISFKRHRPALTHEGNIICLKVSHLLRLLYDRSLTFEVVWSRLAEFTAVACANLAPALLRRVLPSLMYVTVPDDDRPATPAREVTPAADERPATPVKEARPLPPPPKHLPPDIAYGELLEDLDREDARANRRVNRRSARQRNRARRAGIEPPAYVNAVALSTPGEVPEQSSPPPYA